MNLSEVEQKIEELRRTRNELYREVSSLKCSVRYHSKRGNTKKANTYRKELAEIMKEYEEVKAKLDKLFALWRAMKGTGAKATGTDDRFPHGHV